MKKFILIFLLVSMISSFSVIGIDPENCQDSDGGRVYDKKGTATGTFGGQLSSFPDYCCSGERCDLNEGETVLESYCEGIYIRTEHSNCPNGCKDGACVTASVVCTDSDGGLDYNKKGVVVVETNGQKYESNDQCGQSYDKNPSNDPNLLNEKSCRSDGEPIENVYYCPSGCSDGACVAESIVTCTDSDGGKVISEKGKLTGSRGVVEDYCRDTLLNGGGGGPTSSCSGYTCLINEFYCENGNFEASPIFCPSGCKDGACVADSIVTCTDSDGGLDYYIKGYVKRSDFGTFEYDLCEYGNTLVEYYCEKTENRKSRFECTYGCKDGACLKEKSQACPSDIEMVVCKKGQTMKKKPDERREGCFRYYCEGVKSECPSGCKCDAQEVIISCGESCTDSDNGMNEFVKGITTWKAGDNINQQPDYCISEGTLSEGYCELIRAGKSYKRVPIVCLNKCENGVCTVAETMSEKVGCSFKGSNSEQKCYSDDGRFGCQGNDFCVMEVSGDHRDKIRWKSTCGGYVYTVIDGDDETAEFSCQDATQSCPEGCSCYEGKVFECAIDRAPCNPGCKCDTHGEILYCGKDVCRDSDNGKNYYEKGEVTVRIVHDQPESKPDICAADGKIGEKADYYSNLLHEAYCKNNALNYAYEDFYCPNGCSNGACIPFIGNPDEVVGSTDEDSSSKGCPDKKCRELSRKCLGNDQIIFEECTFYIKSKGKECGQITNTNSRIIKGACDKEENQIVTFCQGCQLDESTCIPFGTRLEKADSAYYCGITKKMAVQNENKEACQNSYECLSNNCKSGSCKPICEGCLNEDKACVPLGTRTSSQYCDSDNSFKEQNLEENKCNNNYECSSNLCVNNSCISPRLMQKIINWFKNLFG